MVWGKASEDVHILVKDLATSRVKHQQQLDGRWRWDQRSQEAEVAIYTGQIRRLLSVQGVRSQARCLLDRGRGLGGRSNSCCKETIVGSRPGAEAQERASSPPPQPRTGTPPPQERTILPLKLNFVLSQDLIFRKCHYFSDFLLINVSTGKKSLNI